MKTICTLLLASVVSCWAERSARQPSLAESTQFLLEAINGSTTHYWEVERDGVFSASRDQRYTMAIDGEGMVHLRCFERGVNQNNHASFDPLGLRSKYVRTSLYVFHLADIDPLSIQVGPTTPTDRFNKAPIFQLALAAPKKKKLIGCVIYDAQTGSVERGTTASLRLSLQVGKEKAHLIAQAFRRACLLQAEQSAPSAQVH